MAKERNINITMDSVKRGGKTVSVLLDGKNEIGSIEPAGSKFAAYLIGEDAPQNFKSEDEAVSFLIAGYHLHRR